MTIGIFPKGNQIKETMVSHLLLLVDSKELYPKGFKGWTLSIWCCLFG